MIREATNAQFSFMFNTALPEHRYYRWRTYSLSQGDTLKAWRSAPFQMVAGGTCVFALR